MAQTKRKKKFLNLPKTFYTQNKSKLYALTGLEIFKVEGVQLTNNSGSLSHPAPAKQSIEKIVDGGADMKVKQVANLFYDIIDKLDYFKDCPEEHRNKLTARLCEQDIGYLTSLLTAIYNPSKFKAWVLTANYRPRRKYD